MTNRITRYLVIIVVLMMIWMGFKIWIMKKNMDTLYYNQNVLNQKLDALKDILGNSQNRFEIRVVPSSGAERIN